ncbi:MAG: ABC transporter permease [Deltaproteobacteria bacterium]|nr:ABC transporter permease [Deltaproteobacteria bacterium]
MSALLRRLALALPTLLGVVTLVFFFVHLVPGDPVEMMLGESAAVVDRERMRAALGLDRPLWSQYLGFLARTARGDLGRSLRDGAPVAGLIRARLPATLALAGAAGALAVALAIPLGVLSARHRGRWLDAAATAFALLGAALPNFVLGPLLVLLFSVRLGWLPVSGADSAAGLLLPAATLGLGMSAILTRLTRTAVLDSLGADFIRTARAKGLSEARVFFRHALRGALLPVTTVFGLQLGSLLGGAIITETIFAWPGIGRLTLQAIEGRDYPLVQGCVLVIACGYVAANLLTDLAYQRLDPRVRFGGREAR